MSLQPSVPGPEGKHLLFPPMEAECLGPLAQPGYTLKMAPLALPVWPHESLPLSSLILVLLSGVWVEQMAVEEAADSKG